MDQPKLAEVADHLTDPGNRAFLCEVHVTNTSLDEWQRVIDLGRRHTEWSLEYLEDGEVVALPDRVEVIFQRTQQAATTLRVTPARIAIHAHFFTPDDIEFDVRARDITDQSRLDELLDFVKQVAHATHRPASVTPEAAEDAPFLTYDPTDGTWTRS